MVRIDDAALVADTQVVAFRISGLDHDAKDLTRRAQAFALLFKHSRSADFISGAPLWRTRTGGSAVQLALPLASAPANIAEQVRFITPEASHDQGVRADINLFGTP